MIIYYPLQWFGSLLWQEGNLDWSQWRSDLYQDRRIPDHGTNAAQDACGGQ